MILKGFHLTHHEAFDLFRRFIRIFLRYGFLSNKMINKIKAYQEILNNFNAPATFFITAKPLEKHIQALSKCIEQNIEIGIHGYEHLDYTKLSNDVVHSHFRKAKKIFEDNHIKVSLYRFPYLKHSEKFLSILKGLSLDCDCSTTIYWGNDAEHCNQDRIKLQSLKTYLDQYEWKSADSSISIPRVTDGVVEIPVSLPDDDLLERAHLLNPQTVQNIWGEILRQTYFRGELFTLQLHQERIFLFCYRRRENAINVAI